MQDLNEELENSLKDHSYGILGYRILQSDKESSPRAYVDLLEGITLLLEISIRGYNIVEIESNSADNAATDKIKVGSTYESLTALLRQNSGGFREKMYTELYSALEKVKNE
ncbi:hypothetical protein BB560_007152 [Smittium megazygosporum]|uniref:GSKIP domain-containing protein n=1 Tax=Smittium megazygosporum TaxID=133381 RepID=A0A2T9XYF1_9FUNG|nr:hypothetical protein BB560_007152 [Smittium megazygosporum]